MNITEYIGKCRIIKVNCSYIYKTRLYNIGIYENNIVEVKKNSISGAVVLCDGMEFAIGKKLAKTILIEKL